MPTGQAPHPGGPGEPCTLCFEPGRIGQGLGCGGTKMRHWFCSLCVVQLHQCPICRQGLALCTGPPPRETQDKDLSLARIRILATQNIWAPHDHIAAGTVQISSGWRRLRARRHHRPAPPSDRCAGRWQQRKTPQTTPQATSLTTRCRGAAYTSPASYQAAWDLTTMNVENYRAVTVALSICLPFAFGWLVGDGEWAMGLARNTHSHEWGDLSFRSGGLRPNDVIYRVMAAWSTWKKIPVPEWLRPVVKKAKQPPVCPPQLGTYGNAAVVKAAQSIEAPAHYWSSPSTPADRVNPTPAHSLGKTGTPDTLARPVHLFGPSRGRGAQPGPRSTAGAARALVPSRADQPSPRQERAAKRAVKRYPPTPQYCPDSTSAPTQGATTGDRGDLAPSNERGSTQHHARAATQPDAGARPEEPPGATNLQPTATPNPKRHQAPRNPTPAHGPQHPLTPARTEKKPAYTMTLRPGRRRLDHPSATWQRPRPRHLRQRVLPPRTPVHQGGHSVTGPTLACHNRSDQHWLKPSEGRATTQPRLDRLTCRPQTGRKTRCPNPHHPPHYPQHPACSASPRCPGNRAVPHVLLLRLRLRNLQHHNHLIRRHHHILVQHTTPQATTKTCQMGPQTWLHRRRPPHRQGPRQSKARAPSPAKTHDHHHVTWRLTQRRGPQAIQVRCRHHQPARDGTDPTESIAAGPEETAKRDRREGLDSRRAAQLAVMSTEATDKCDKSLMHYDTDVEMDLKRFENGPLGTGWHNTDEERPRDPQQPAPGAHAGEPAGNANPPPSTPMGDSAQRNAAADPRSDARATTAASPEMADAAGEAPCPQAIRQPEAETCAVPTTGHTDAAGQRTTHTADSPPVVLREERTEGAAGNAHASQPATVEEHVQLGATTSPAPEGMQGGPPPGAPKTKDILASICSKSAPTAGQGPRMDE